MLVSEFFPRKPKRTSFRQENARDVHEIRADLANKDGEIFRCYESESLIS